MITTAERVGLRLGLLAGTGAVVAVVVGLAVLIRDDWSPLRTADRRVVRALELPHGWTRDLVVILTQLGAPLLLELAATTLAVLLLVGRRHRPALYLVVAVFGAQLLSTTSKQVVARVRPCAEQLVGCPSSPSFPSGHAVGAAAFWTAAAVLLLPVAGRAVWSVALVLPLVVALSRVLLGVHYPSDVVAGLLVGWSWAAVSTAVFATWRGSNQAAMRLWRPVWTDRALSPDLCGQLAQRNFIGLAEGREAMHHISKHRQRNLRPDRERRLRDPLIGLGADRCGTDEHPSSSVCRQHQPSTGCALRQG